MSLRELDLGATRDHLVKFIRDEVAASGLASVVVGISGGVDSGLSTALAVHALGAERVHPILLPYQDWQPEGRARARELARALSIPQTNVTEIDIAPMVQAAFSLLGLTPPAGGQIAPDAATLRRGNVMARARMILLFDTARRLGALVLGTENRSEHHLGYYTRYGDEASDLEPLRRLWKGEVVSLARHLGLPRSILDAPPTAGLWHGQTDEGEFGFTYEEADRVLEARFDRGLDTEALTAEGIAPESARRVLDWAQRVAYKSRLPALGPEPVLRRSS